MSDFIPQELVTQILLRVPPKSLIRLRCVCKLWKSLISSPEFVSMHTQWGFLAKTSKPRILVRHYSEAQGAELYSVHHDNEAFAIDDDAKIFFPFRSSWDPYFAILGSSNGLVLLSDDMFGINNVVMLWNPIIRRKITLPSPRATHENIGPYHSELGFGYDVKRNDFKVVRLTYRMEPLAHIEDKFPPIVEVFSLSTGYWRELNQNPIRNRVIGFPPTHAFVNGKVHWIAYGETFTGMERNLIQVFDISDEVFEEMPLPNVIVREQLVSSAIAVYEESLAVVLYNNQDFWHMQCSIWVMEEYGVGNSWTNMFNIHIEGQMGRVLSFRKNGDILLSLRNRKLISYNPRTGGTMELGVFHTSYNDRSDDTYALTYIECLALLNEGEQALSVVPDERQRLLVEGLAGLPNPSESDFLDDD